MKMELVDVPKRLQFDAEKLRRYLQRYLDGFSCAEGKLKVKKFALVQCHDAFTSMLY